MFRCKIGWTLKMLVAFKGLVVFFFGPWLCSCSP